MLITYEYFNITPEKQEYRFSISGAIEAEFEVSSDNIEYKVNDDMTIYLDIDSSYNKSVVLKISY